MEGKLDLTPMQAEEEVNTLFARLGIDYIVTDIWLYGEGTSTMLGSYGKFLVPPERYAYDIRCVSTKGGSPNIYIQNFSWGELPFEYINIMMDDNGIFLFNWLAPLDIVETMVVNAQLLTFDKIENIFKAMIPVAYENYKISMQPVNSMEFTIERAILGLHRIADKNSDVTGLLVPVWCFYGSLISNSGGNSYPYNADSAAEPLIIINAVDGTIIAPFALLQKTQYNSHNNNNAYQA